jgi:hypothetical protein
LLEPSATLLRRLKLSFFLISNPVSEGQLCVTSRSCIFDAIRVGKNIISGYMGGFLAARSRALLMARPRTFVITIGNTPPPLGGPRKKNPTTIIVTPACEIIKSADLCNQPTRAVTQKSHPSISPSLYGTTNAETYSESSFRGRNRPLRDTRVHPDTLR